MRRSPLVAITSPIISTTTPRTAKGSCANLTVSLINKDHASRKPSQLISGLRHIPIPRTMSTEPPMKKTNPLNLLTTSLPGWLSAAFFAGALGNALQDTEDSDDGTLHLNWLLSQYPGYIGVQSLTAIAGVPLSYHRRLGG